MSHSCVRVSVDDFFAGHDAMKDVYQTFVVVVQSICGDILVNVNKTRISLQLRTRFISINGMTKEGLKVHFVMYDHNKSDRFTKIEKFDDVFLHHTILQSESDIDEEVKAWIKEASHYGLQQR